MERRDALKTMGAAAALALLPHEAFAAWARAGSGLRPVRGLTDAQLALVGAIADTILPRTDSPSATDVGVPAFIDVVVTEQFADADREAFLLGLDALDADARGNGAAGFAALAPGARGSAIERIEGAGDRSTEPAHTYWRLKGLVLHGYFTSEPVMKNVLKTVIMPGAFNGSAPMPSKGVRVGGSHG